MLKKYSFGETTKRSVFADHGRDHLISAFVVFSRGFCNTSAADGKWICEKQSSQIKKLLILRDGVRSSM